MAYLQEVQSVLRELKPQLMSKYGVSTLGLFGSIVRDDFTPESDIDIVVSFSRPIGIEFVTLADELEDKFNRKVDLVSRNGIKPRHWAYIEPEVLYV
ncbi:nucleotidyltransferase family protein [Mucilaginibacter galii]|uniref:Nucleotidyltransferase n=1 Tax=Mucilaginibacter galii TaxID=2005073 RepID=A0A917J8B3_9SPHI|nr:nucleotidyltransferase family protein [Mucilaginibacter galii]GGI49154.1 nucleotidyltransferase [Mucilaginibacter galii]